MLSLALSRLTLFVCSFQLTFVDPMSHSILYSLLRNFMELICNTTNGLEVDGMGFFLAGQLQDRMDTFSEKFEYPSAYNRRPPKFRR